MNSFLSANYFVLLNDVIIFYFRNLAKSMQMYLNPADFIQNPNYWIPNYSLFKEHLDYLVPENSIVLIGLNNVRISINVKTPINFIIVKKIKEVSEDLEIPMPKLEYFEEKYAIHFTIYEIPPALYKYWKSTRLNGTINLPKNYKFIPSEENFSTLPPQDLFNTPMLVTSKHPRVAEVYVYSTLLESPTVTLTCALESKFIETNIQTAGKERNDCFKILCMLDFQSILKN